MSSALRLPPRLPSPRNPQLDFKQRSPGKPYRFIPPNNGLNLKDALENMKPGDALRLDNMIAQPDGISTRNGRDLWTPATGTPYRSLFAYSAPGGQDSMFAVSENGYILNVTEPGPYVVPTVPGAPFTATEFSTAQIMSGAGTFMAAVNGVDPPVQYSATNGWQAHTMTFAAEPTIINSFAHVSSHMGRLWFVPKDSAMVFYLPPAAIGGVLTPFAVNLRRGGHIVCTGALSRDGGLGSDDLFVIISSKGEVLTYSGTNPSSLKTWGLVGSYTIPPPVGRRCLAKMGADLAVLTTRGLAPMAEVMRLASVMQSKATLTDRISSTLGYEWDNNGDEFGWELCEYPSKNLVIVNVPKSATESFPYVMHAETGGWCRWTQYDATCFCAFKDRLYSADAFGRVWLYGDSHTDYDPVEDADRSILCEMMTHFDVLQSPTRKSVAAVRPTFKGPAAYGLPVVVTVDYDNTLSNLQIGVINIKGQPWNTTKWGLSTPGLPLNDPSRPPWGPRNQPTSEWQVSRGYGYAIAVGMKFYTNDNVTITGVDMLYEEMAPL